MKRISQDVQARKIFFKLKDKNKTLTRRNGQLSKLIRNISYILSTDSFFFGGQEKPGKGGK